MIDDKMAKMAVNTLIAYCDGKRCADCAVSKTCDRSNGKPRYFASYPLVGLFGNLQKSTKKPPKFDITLKDSTDFREYTNEIFMREAEKAGLPMNTANSIKWSANGEIKVTFVDDENLIYSTINHNSNKDALNIAVGNCFRKYKEAEANAAVIMKRIKKAAELLKKLRDERDEQHETCLRTRLPETWGKVETL